VCTNCNGELYRIPLPGHPIVDGIGEGKPINQDNAAPFLTGRYVQVLDMNQVRMAAVVALAVLAVNSVVN